MNPESFHAHRCDGCGTVWRHSENCLGDDLAHQCPTCGRESWWRYEGEQQPDPVHDGLVSNSPALHCAAPGGIF